MYFIIEMIRDFYNNFMAPYIYKYIMDPTTYFYLNVFDIYVSQAHIFFAYFDLQNISAIYMWGVIGVTKMLFWEVYKSIYFNLLSFYL